MNASPILRLLCPAKLNLTLAVGPPRSDGFHDVDSLVVMTDLCDELTAMPRDDDALTLECDRAGLPTDPSNLVLRAVTRLQAECPPDTPRGLAFGLIKRIPLGAGLGGGSSNAAAALRLAAEFRRPAAHPTLLKRVAAAVGSDVSLFLEGCGLVRAVGRGEQVHPSGFEVSAYAAIVLAGIHCDTAAVYRRFDALERFERLDRLQPEAFGARLVEAQDELLFNDLRAAACVEQPSLAELAARLEAGAGCRLHLSGSGSALYRLFATRGEAQAFAGRAGRAVPGIGVAVTRVGAPPPFIVGR